MCCEFARRIVRAPIKTTIATSPLDKCATAFWTNARFYLTVELGSISVNVFNMGLVVDNTSNILFSETVDNAVNVII